jgi:hypothetical protein
MEITVKKKEAEADELPAEEKEVEGADVVAKERERLRQLELENAEMRGKLSVSQPNKPSPVDQFQQQKLRVMTDINTLDDETFERTYKMPKHSASMAMFERENEMTRAESKRAIAEAEAKAEMSAKYGSNFYAIKAQIEDSLDDLSPEVRQDPKRLAKHMERQYMALQSERRINEPEKIEPRKKIVSDFAKPGVGSVPGEKPPVEPETDEIPAEYQPLSKAMGITSEKERKEMMKRISDGEYVPMNLGGGVVFQDPNKGFEKVAPK